MWLMRKISKKKVPSVVHVDNTCRVQTVGKKIICIFTFGEKFNEFLVFQYC